MDLVLFQVLNISFFSPLLRRNTTYMIASLSRVIKKLSLISGEDENYQGEVCGRYLFYR